MKKRIGIVTTVALCLFFLAMAGAARFLAAVVREKEERSQYFENEKFEEILQKAEKFKERYDYQLLAKYLGLFPGVTAGLDDLEGDAALRIRRFDAALAAYERPVPALYDRPRFVSHFMCKQGEALMAEGRYVGAVDRYRKALELDPHNVTASYNMEILVAFLYQAAQQEDKAGGKKKSGLDDLGIKEFNPWSEDKKKLDDEEEKDLY